MNPQNCRALPHMTGAQVLTCGNLAVLPGVLRSVRPESTICILACLTNFLTSPEVTSTSGSAGIRVQPVLLEYKELLLDFCSEMPERFV